MGGSDFILGVIVGGVGVIALEVLWVVSLFQRAGSDPEFQRVMRELQTKSRYVRYYKEPYRY